MATIEGISIELSQVDATADQLRALNTQLEQKLTEIRAQVDQLAGSWQSDASGQFQAKFKTLSAKFPDFTAIVDEYAQFLKRTVADYTQNETAITQKASAFN